jgi:hypothetical protein
MQVNAGPKHKFKFRATLQNVESKSHKMGYSIAQGKYEVAIEAVPGAVDTVLGHRVHAIWKQNVAWHSPAPGSCFLRVIPDHLDISAARFRDV